MDEPGRQRLRAERLRERSEPQLQPQRLPQPAQLQLRRPRPQLVSSAYAPVFAAGASFLNIWSHFPSCLPAFISFWDNCPY